MFAYFLIFSLLGYFIGKSIQKEKGFTLIIVLALIWGISSAPIWGLASLGEMFLGFYIARNQ